MFLLVCSFRFSIFQRNLGRKECETQWIWVVLIPNPSMVLRVAPIWVGIPWVVLGIIIIWGHTVIFIILGFIMVIWITWTRGEEGTCIWEAISGEITTTLIIKGGVCHGEWTLCSNNNNKFRRQKRNQNQKRRKRKRKRKKISPRNGI